MNLKRKSILLSILLLAALAILAGCAAEVSPYEENDAQGHTLSVRYDANGGYFTTNTSVIVDSYDPAALPQKEGKLSLALLSPGDSARGNDAFTPVKSGYFLAGWYAERTQTADGQYTYGSKWDFSTDRLEVEADGAYSSHQPVLTLYAAWVPLFQVEFYDAASGELLGNYTLDPTVGKEIAMPGWDLKSGAMEMEKFPVKKGYTFEKATLGTVNGEAVTTETLIHPGAVDEESGTATDTVLKLYLSYTEGEWYRISTVEQFLENASVSGSYEICADLDFTGAIWPTSLMYGNFSGTIHGNGHTISNVELTQTNNSKTNAGLFGALTDTAVIRDLKLDNVTFTVKSGTRVAGTSYGLFAGTVSGNAQLSDISITNSILQVDSGCYFGTEEYAIGLICGSGQTAIDPAGVTTQAVGDAPQRVTLTVDGQSVTVQIATE